MTRYYCLLLPGILSSPVLTLSPTPQPTLSPTTLQPTPKPTAQPTFSPTFQPTIAPTTLTPTTLQPTTSPTTLQPTTSPTTSQPTLKPTTHPTTRHPTTPHPTRSPTPQPTSAPTLQPTLAPTLTPTLSPTTATPTAAPSVAPTSSPTRAPTNQPTLQPTTSAPTASPTTLAPTHSPTHSPTTSHPTRAPAAAGFSWAQTFGVLFAFSTLCGPLPPNALQWLATVKRWRPVPRTDHTIAFAFHRHATVCCAVLVVRWSLEMFATVGVWEVVGFILMNFAIYIMELWVWLAAYHTLSTAYIVSLSTFSRRTTRKIFAFLSVQWWVATSFAYGLGIATNNEVYDVISHSSHTLGFVILFLLLMYHSQRLHARLGGRDVNSAKQAKENMALHLRRMYLICIASLIAAAVSMVFLLNRLLGNGRRCVVCSTPMARSETWIHFIAEACMFLGLLLGTYMNWVPLRARPEVQRSLLPNAGDVTFDITPSTNESSGERGSRSVSRNIVHSVGSPVSVSVKMARSPPDEPLD